MKLSPELQEIKQYDANNGNGLLKKKLSCSNTRQF